jgi:hypothetical protein
MKNKGIPFVEQHIEKFVLGAAGFVFLSVVAWQIVGTHNNVTLDGRNAAPSEIDEALAARTQTLAQKLEAPAPSIGDKLGERLKPQADSFAQLLGASVSPAAELPSIQPALAKVLQSEGATAGTPFHVPKFPTMAMRPTVQVSDTLDPSVVEQNAALKAMFPTGATSYDITWAVPNAVLDVKTMRSELQSSSGGAQIPGFWYRSTLFLIDVEFQRERKLTDGSWGESIAVPALPGQFSFRPEIAKGADAGLRDAAFNYLADKAQQRQIVQPDFYLTKRSIFSPAMLLSERDSQTGEVSENPEDAKLDGEIRRLKRELGGLAVQAKRIKEDLDGIGGPLEDTSKEDKKKEEEKKKKEEEQGGNQGGNRGGGGGGLGRPGGGLGGAGSGGSAGGMSGRNNPAAEANREKRIALTKKLKKIDSDTKSKEESLAEKLKKRGISESEAKTRDAASSDLETADSLVVWAHDLGVKPGEQYRYRAIAKAYNPFFTNGSLLVDAQKKLGDGFTLDTVASDWSDPFRVSPPVRFFVVDAQAGEGRLGVGQATVEVYRYFDGQRRKSRFTVQPGDEIAQSKDGIAFETGFFLVDVYTDPASERGGADRRPVALAVVQNALGDRYEVRIPREDLNSDDRIEFEDEIAIAKADSESAKSGGSDAAPPTGSSGAGGRGGSDRPY